MISKELLSEILKEYKFPFSYEYNTYNDYTKKIYFYVNSELKIDFFSINIYELAHKCKEWAIGEHDCELLSCIGSKDRAICDIYSDKYNCKFTHYADTEPEAIFAACQWIIDTRS